MVQVVRRSLPSRRVIDPEPAEDTRGATPERLRHAQGFVERGNPGRGRGGIVTMRDAPIERALARKTISQSQYTAAVKYRHHWYRAGLASPLSSVELNRIFATDMANYSDLSRLREWIRSTHDTPLPIGLFIPYATAWNAVKEFIETDGELPTSIEWIPNRELPPGTFPDP